MLADLTLLLHEVTNALRGRRDVSPAEDVTGEPLAAARLVVLITGTASPGKAQLQAALARALAPSGTVVSSPGQGALPRHALHVHAEADIDALLETRPGTAGAWARRADLLVPVDWEPTRHSVRRVIAALVARGHDVPESGA